MYSMMGLQNIVNFFFAAGIILMVTFFVINHCC